MNKTTLTFHTGLDTIGAVILEVKYGENRAFFEAGTAYNPSFDMFDGQVNLRRNNLIKDYLWTNELPHIDYIYRKEDIDGTDLKPACEFKGQQAFFITHLHLDHMRMMGMIDSTIPVYLTSNAQRIEFAQEDIGIGVETIRHHQYNDIPDDIQIGDIKIHKFILNDDSYQDLSFFIETPDLKIHYTGDIFVYGKYFNNIKNEIAYINQKGVDILIPEGTTFWGGLDENIEVSPTFTPKDLLMKDEVDSRLAELIKNYNGFVFFNIYEREMSDVMDIEKYSKIANRIPVYEPKQAYIINKFFNTKVHCMIPDVYKTKPDWLINVIENNIVLNKKDILNNPDKYLIQNSYENLLELLDYRNTKSLYLHISGTPLGDFDPAYKRMKSFIIDNLNFDYHTRSNWPEENKIFSNHATREQLLQYQEEVDCKLIVPCHSANRKAYIHNIKKPNFYAELKKTYIYDKDNNTLKEIDYE